MVDAIHIGDREVGHGRPCFFIAEAGVNHNGDVALAEQLIDAATIAGADAVKFQTFNAERLVTPDAPKAEYQRATTSGKDSQFEMLRRLELSVADHDRLMAHCQDRGILFLSTPFEEESADFLSTRNIAAFKIPSGEVTNLPFLRHVARKGRPMIVSTGMCDLGEVREAVHAIRDEGNEQLVLLHCVSNYPADPGDVNLRAMATMRAAFDVGCGYSDHTLGIEVSLAAVAQGACVIEKHFTLDRTLPGPDHEASLEPEALAALIRGIKTVESSLGDGQKRAVVSEFNSACTIRKSLVAAQDIDAGQRITEELIAAKRPGTGLPPSMKEQVIGLTARRSILAGTLIDLDLVA